MEITQEVLKNLQMMMPSNFAIYCLKGDTAEILYLAPGLAELNGMSWQEYQEKSLRNSFAMIFPEDMPKLLRKAKACTRTGDQFDINYRVFHKTYGFDWAHAIYRRIGEKQGYPVFVGIFTNASVETDPYQNIIDYTARRIYVCDKHTYDVLYANKAARDYAQNNTGHLFKQKCYGFIWGKAEPCEPCWLREDTLGQGINQKVFDEKKQCWEQSLGRYLNWCGHEAFVQYIDDISESERQKLLLKNTFEIEQRLLRANRILNGKGDVDSRINKLLSDLGTYLQADRAYVVRIKGSKLYNTHEWCKVGVEPEINKIQGIDLSYMDRWQQFFQVGQCVFVPDIEAIRISFPYEYEIMSIQGIHSYVEAPLFLNGVLCGFLGLDNPNLENKDRPASVLGNILLSLSYSLADVLEKKKALDELQESQQLYKIAIEGASLDVWEYDIRQHKIIGSKGGSFTFPTPGDIENVPESLLPYILPEDRQKMREFYRKLTARNVETVSEDFWMQWSPEQVPYCRRVFYSVIKDKKGVPVKAYGISMDVTVQKQQTKKFKQAMGLLITANPDAVAMAQFNLTQNKLSEKYGISATTKKLLRTDTLEGLFANVTRFIISAEDKQHFTDRFNRKALLEGFKNGITARQLEYYRRKLYSSPVWIRCFINLLENPDTGDVEGVIYSQEISREKQMEEVSHIINSLEYDLIAIIHPDTEMIEAVNVSPALPEEYRKIWPEPGAAFSFPQIYESTKDWIAEEKWPEYLKNTSIEYIREELDKQERCEFIFGLNFPSRPEGIRYRKFQYYYLNANKEEILVVASDVTSTYQAQQEEIAREKELRTQAEAANAAKSEFLSRMSHDIRTPLNGIMGMAYIAQQQQNLPQTAECLKNIDISSKFLLGLINEILDMAKVENNKLELHPEPYPPEDFKAYMKAVVLPLCQDKHQQLLLDIRMPGDYCVLFDRLSINRVVFNLLSNAVKYTPEGGTIKYLAEGKVLPDKKTMTMHIVISDNGIGISKEFQKIIFEPFSQENRNDISNQRGTGLGLAITKKLVELQGGTIQVESELGRGSIFSLDFVCGCVPMSQVIRWQAAPQESPGDVGVLAGKRVLLCEDHPLNRMIAKTLLTKKGMVIETAENGQEALECFQRSPLNYYAVVLMDVRMPVMDGLTATRQIRALDRADAARVPIVAMTANTFPEDIANCLKAGMNTHLGKPVEPQLLYQTLANLLEKKT